MEHRDYQFLLRRNWKTDQTNGKQGFAVFPKDKLKILIDDVKSSSEPLNIQKVGTPWGNVRDDMYLRYCEMNLWGEMDLQIEPQISDMPCHLQLHD